MVPEPDRKPDKVRLESLTYDMPSHRHLLEALLLAFRPARWSIFGFRFVRLLLLAGGVWAVVYGGFYHRIAVTETHEEQFTIIDPSPPPPAPPGMAPFSPSDAFGQPTDAFGQPTDASGQPDAFSPPVKYIQLVKINKTTSAEREVTVNRAVTVAGIIRDPQGEIVRVGDAAEGPDFCPS